jgi:hypothetical protein
MTPLWIFALIFQAATLNSGSSGQESQSQWVFAHAQTSNRLIALIPRENLPQSQAARLSWAVCPNELVVTPVTLAANSTPAGTEVYSYHTSESVTPGSYCLLIDSASHDAMFFWGLSSRGLPHSRECVRGFAEAAELSTGRKVDSCYFIGSYGTGAVELIEYKHQLRTDRMAALLVDDERNPADHKYWMAAFPFGDRVWSSDGDENFHPERFRYLFTMLDNATSEVSFIGIEWDGPDGAYLTLYRPVGTELAPFITNYYPSSQVITRK